MVEAEHNPIAAVLLACEVWLVHRLGVTGPHLLFHARVLRMPWNIQGIYITKHDEF